MSLDGKLEPCDVVVLKTILIAHFSAVDTAAKTYSNRELTDQICLINYSGLKKKLIVDRVVKYPDCSRFKG